MLSGSNCDAVQFGGPTLRVLEARRIANDAVLRQLGPNIISDDFSVGAAVAALRRAERTLGLGEALLDQHLISGIGNIFKSEGCFAAGISPWHWIGELEDDELAHVIRKTQELMRVAADSGRQPRQVYRRAGQPCPRCGTALRSRGQGDANRTTYWCPGCQS